MVNLHFQNPFLPDLRHRKMFRDRYEPNDLASRAAAYLFGTTCFVKNSNGQDGERPIPRRLPAHASRGRRTGLRFRVEGPCRARQNDSRRDDRRTERNRDSGRARTSVGRGDRPNVPRYLRANPAAPRILPGSFAATVRQLLPVQCQSLHQRPRARQAAAGQGGQCLHGARQRHPSRCRSKDVPLECAPSAEEPDLAIVDPAPRVVASSPQPAERTRFAILDAPVTNA